MTNTKKTAMLVPDAVTAMVLVGKKILGIRRPTEAEAEALGLDALDPQSPYCLEVEGGALIVPLQDPEGNGWGHTTFVRPGSTRFPAEAYDVDEVR